MASIAAMTTKSYASGQWVVRCDRCGSDTPEVCPTAAKALASLPRFGWIRRRPGLEDFCDTCQE